MANVKKYTKGALGHMFAHYERRKDDEGNYIKFGNQNIDISRTELNYNLAPDRGMSELDYIKKRVEVDGVRLHNRKDVNVMFSWVITKPSDYKGDSRQFFEACYEFMAPRYGEENVLSSYVHLDETTDHMHFSAMPITYDPKHEDYHFNAKKVISRGELRVFHNELNDYLKSKGIECSILNEITQEGDKSIKELQRGTAIEELNNVKEELCEAKEELNSTKGDIDALLEEENRLKGQIMSLEDINNIDVKKNMFGKERVDIAPEDLINMKYTLMEQSNQIEKLTDSNNNLKQYINSRSEEYKLGKAVSDIREEIERLKYMPKLYSMVKNVLAVVERCKDDRTGLDAKMELFKLSNKLDETTKNKTKHRNYEHDIER